jgi:hypothetical protein
MIPAYHVERLIQSFRMGPNASDLFIDPPVTSSGDFRHAPFIEAINLLTENASLQAIYVRAQLTSGEVIGATPIRPVKRYPRDNTAFCTNH